MNEVEKNRTMVIITVVAWMFQILYTLSPIDLIPDFIPFLGVFDDLLGLAGVVSMTFYVGYMMRNGGWELLFPQENPVLVAEPESYEPIDERELRNL